jgi:DNA-binding transcriptional ArsR family regulator
VTALSDAGILKLAGDGRVRTILAALAEGPLRPAELQRRAGISRETLYKRLHELTELRMVSSSRSCRFPFSVCYEFTRDGRVAYTKTLLTAREQRRVLAPESLDGGDDICQLLRVLTPVLRLDQPQKGTCLLIEEDPTGRPARAGLVAEGRSIDLLTNSSKGASDATIEGAGSAWDSALNGRQRDQLKIHGDAALAQAVLEALGAILAP